MIEVREYIDGEGRRPFLRWIEGQDREAKLRITSALDKLRAGNLGVLKGLSGGLFEVRIDFGPGYRVYCGRDGDTVVILLAGGTKKRQQEDIREAKSLWRNYKARQGNG